MVGVFMIMIPVLIILVCALSQVAAVTGNASSWAGLSIDSRMLCHSLTWRAPDLLASNNSTPVKYSVMYRMRTFKDWETVPGCVNISASSCEFGKDITFITGSDYWLKVAATTSSPIIVMNSTAVQFRPEIDTQLLPPRINHIERIGKALFLRPELPDHCGQKTLDKHLSELKYQVHYWALARFPDALNKTVTTKIQKEVPLPVQENQKYCARIRLYLKHREHSPRMSAWSNPEACTGGGQDLPISPEAATTNTVAKICGSIVAMTIVIGLIYALLRLYKVYKFINQKDDMPQNLEFLIHDSSLISDKPDYSSPETVDDIWDNVYLGGSSSDNWTTETHWDQEDGEVLETVSLSADTNSPNDSDYVQERNSALQFCCNTEGSVSKSLSESDFAYFSGEEIEGILAAREMETRVPGSPSIKAFKSLQELLRDTEYDCEQTTSMDRNSLSSYEGQHCVLLARQRQENSKASLNFYDHEPTRGLQTELTMEKFNSSYSTNPHRSVPDLLYNDYINIPVT